MFNEDDGVGAQIIAFEILASAFNQKKVFCLSSLYDTYTG